MERIKRKRKLEQIEMLSNNEKLSLADAADLIGVCRPQIYRYVRDGAIKVTYTLHPRKTKIIGSELKRFCRVN